ETSSFSAPLSSVPIVDSHIDSGRMTKSITMTKAMIGHVNISPMISLGNEDVSKIKTVDARSTDMFSTTCPTFPIADTYFFVHARVSPMTVTASIPVSCMTTSAIAKHRKTKDSTIGDFKYSGNHPLLAI